MAALSSTGALVEIADAAPWVSKSPSPWVRGPLWDGFWILSALWLAPIAVLLAHGYSNPESSPLDLLYFGLTAVFWIGHRLSSTYLAYCTEAYRPLLREQPIRFIVLPIVVTAGCFALFLPADSVLPWTREERLIGLAIVDYACVTYHFAAQHFGALSLYRSRAERGWCIQTRRLDRFFALTVGGVLVFVADILAGAVAYTRTSGSIAGFRHGSCRLRMESASVRCLRSLPLPQSSYWRNCAHHIGRCHASCTLLESQ